MIDGYPQVNKPCSSLSMSKLNAAAFITVSSLKQLLLNFHSTLGSHEKRIHTGNHSNCESARCRCKPYAKNRFHRREGESKRPNVTTTVFLGKEALRVARKWQWRLRLTRRTRFRRGPVLPAGRRLTSRLAPRRMARRPRSGLRPGPPPLRGCGWSWPCTKRRRPQGRPQT